MNLDTDSLLELANKVTGKQHYAHTRNDGEIHIVSVEPAVYDAFNFRSRDHYRFAPSLTGEFWQKAQALDCIVAALNLPGGVGLYKIVTSKGTYFQVIHDRDPGLVQEDILTAAAQAILRG